MRKFAIPVEMRHYKKRRPDDVYLSEGYIEVEAADQAGAFEIVRDMLNRANPNVLQTTDKRIRWTIHWPSQQSGLVYEDWTFGVSEFTGAMA